jgi:twitching motility protein PilT
VTQPAHDQGKASLDTLLELAVERNASDLHLRVGRPPILRIQGVIVRLADHVSVTASDLDAMLSQAMPPDVADAFAETFDADFAYELPTARFRVNVARARHGTAAVFRRIPPRIVTADELRLSPEIRSLCALTKGLVLVTGPTGSGKSTTLCALIDLVNRTRDDHIITIEDPIEFVHEDIRCVVTQREVGTHTRSFKAALRGALREDPDVVLIGEMRDLESVSMALETAETGHLVFGSLHTTTAASTVDRIIDQFPAMQQDQIRTMLASSLRGVVSQILCKAIDGSRVAAREILFNTPPIANLIRERKMFQVGSIMQTSKRMGMVTMNDALMALVESGEISAAEAHANATDKAGIVAALLAKGLDGIPDAARDPANVRRPPNRAPG